MAVNEKLQAEVAITAKVDQKSFQNAEKLVDKLTWKRSIIFDADTSKFNKKLTDAVKELWKISNKKVELNVDVNKKSLQKNIWEIDKEIASILKVDPFEKAMNKIRVSVSKGVNKVVNEVDRIQQKFTQLSSKQFKAGTITVHAETNEAVNRLTALSKQSQKIRAELEKWEKIYNVKVDTTSAVNSLINTNSVLNQTQAKITQTVNSFNKLKSKSFAVTLQDKVTKWLNNIKSRLEEIWRKKTKVQVDGSWLAKTENSLKWIWYKLIEIWAVAGTAKWIQVVSDSYTSLINKLSTVTQTRNEAEEWFKALTVTANNARVPVEEYITTFQRLQLVNKELGWSLEETNRMVETLSKWLIASWATTSEAASVMLQFSQAFWAWRLQGDEFRSISENMPILLDILAKQLWVARWELKELAKEWKITSEVLREALLGIWVEKIWTMFDSTTATMWQALTIIKNNLLVAFWELDKATWLTEKVVWALSKLNNIITAIGNNQGLLKVIWLIWSFVGIIASVFWAVKVFQLLQVAVSAVAAALWALWTPVLVIAWVISAIIVFRNELAPLIEQFNWVKEKAMELWQSLLNLWQTLIGSLWPAVVSLVQAIVNLLTPALWVFIKWLETLMWVLTTLVNLFVEWVIPWWKAWGDAVVWLLEKMRLIPSWIDPVTEKIKKNTEALKENAKQTKEVQDAQEQTVKSYKNLNDATNWLSDAVLEHTRREKELQAQLDQWIITEEEFQKAIEEWKEALYAMWESVEEVKKALEIIQDEQLSYMDKIQKMNELRLSRSEFVALINVLRDARMEAIATAKAVAQALRTEYEWAKMRAEFKNIEAGWSAWSTWAWSLATTKDVWLQFVAGQYYEEWFKADMELKQLEKDLENFNAEVEKSIKYKDEFGWWADPNDRYWTKWAGAWSWSWSGWWSSKQQDEYAKKEKELREQALKDIERVNDNQIMDEKEKAMEIKRINEKLEKDLADLRKDAVEKGLDINKEWVEEVEKAEKEKQESIKKTYDLLNDALKEIQDVFEDAIDAEKDKLEEFEDQVKDARKEIEDLREDVKKLDEDIANLWKEKEDKLQERFNKVKEEIEKKTKDVNEIMEKFNKAQQYWLIRQEWWEWLPNKDLQGNHWESALKDYAKMPKLQEELNELLREEKQLREALSEEQIKEAEAKAKMTETEKIILEYQEKIAKKEAEKQAKEDAIKEKEEEIALLQESIDRQNQMIEEFEERKLQIEEEFKLKKFDIEKQITDNLEREAIARERILERLNEKALETISNMRLAWLWAPWTPQGWLASMNNTTNRTVNIWEINMNVSWQDDARAVIEQIENYWNWIY